MQRVLAILVILTIASLFTVSVRAQNEQQLGENTQQLDLLQHFVTLPSGLGAEGLAIHDGHFYVGTFSFTASDGTILVLDGDGTLTQKIIVPGLPAVGQLAFAGDETLFAVAGNFATGRGSVVRVDTESGAVTTFATGFKLPNGLAVDSGGDLFVTDLIAGTVSRITPSGTVSVFASGPLLAPAPLPIGLTLGPNDLAFDEGQTALYVSNVGLGTIVKIEVRNDGAAGDITNFATVPTPDGVAFDVKGNLYVTSIFTNSTWIVGGDGSAHKLVLDMTHESLNNPSNVAFLGRELYITNLALTGFSGISVVTVSYPGMPLGLDQSEDDN